jgi:hypothetical protein
MTTLSALDDAGAIARALVAAALDLTGLDSAVLLRAEGERDGSASKTPRWSPSPRSAR